MDNFEKRLLSEILQEKESICRMKAEAAATKYAEELGGCYTNDYYGFLAGVEWILNEKLNN